MGVGYACGGGSVTSPCAIAWSVGFAFKESVCDSKTMRKV